MIFKNQVIVYLSLETNSFPVHTKALHMLEGQEIKYKENTEYLGMILDDQLTWEKHITDVTKKIVKYTGIFSKERHLIPEECRLTLRNSFVFSRLNYGIEVYANTG